MQAVSDCRPTFSAVKNKSLKHLLTTLLFLQTIVLKAQSDSAKKFSFSGYGELYYSFDFSKPASHDKAPFLYNHKRHNEVNANLLFGKVHYEEKNVRGDLALMAGNYAQYNLSAEPAWAQFVLEANMGVKLSKTENIWLDAGILPSHIGFESAVSADCWTLTRSLLAENSPYYEAGIKLGYTNQKETVNLNVLALNGWQKIRRPQGMQRPSFGMQVTVKAGKKWQLNYSNFLGSDRPDSLKTTRFFHNFYAIYGADEKWGFIAGFDIGNERYSANNTRTWYSPVLIVRCATGKKTKLALRGEYYHDPAQVIIGTGTANGFRTTGASANFDYAITEKLLWRVEGKLFSSKDRVFQNQFRRNWSLTTNLAIRL
jgi:hypothetical protein